MKEEYKFVANNSKYVSINYDKLDNFIKDLNINSYIHWSKNINLDLDEKEWIILVFIIESMNFCFWQKPKWIIEYKDEKLSGSNALFYSIIKEVEKDKSFFKIDNLDLIDKDKLNLILGNCPFIEERYSNFKEVINKIKESNFFTELFSIKTDIELLEFIITNFKSFDDKSIYKDRVIHFNKRANLLVNDLYYVSKTIRNNINNVNNICGCADYGIPRTFRDYGILIYDKKLDDLIENEKEILHDSEMEIEIRSNMLYVIELIKERLDNKVNSIELDNIIWLKGKKIIHITKVHHTKTIYY